MTTMYADPQSTTVIPESVADFSDMAALASTLSSSPNSPSARDRLLSRAHEKMERLAYLPSGWDGGSARSPEFLAIFVAGALLERLVVNDGPTPQLTPTVDGGLVIEWLVNNQSLTALISPDGASEVLAEDASGVTIFEGTYPWRMPDTELLDKAAAYVTVLGKGVNVRALRS